MNCSGGNGSGSLPRLCLTEISQNETAQEDLVGRVTNGGGNGGGQCVVAGNKPEEFAGVQKDFDLPSNVCITSSGNGIEVVRHGELAAGKAEGAELLLRLWVENGEQVGHLFGQGFRAF
jgi:hypothetical protein